MDVTFATVMALAGIWLVIAGVTGRESLIKIGPFKFFGGGNRTTQKIFGSRHHQIVNVILGMIFLTMGVYVVLEILSIID